jgi:uncharacterized membrane protein (UPF0127 family)
VRCVSPRCSFRLPGARPSSRLFQPKQPTPPQFRPQAWSASRSVIRSGTTDHQFTVEVAATFQQQERGLMFRDHVGPNEGMIFPFRTPRPATFWMKNTMVPLDMVFVRADGTIARIAANTTPYSLDPVGVGEPVAAVLEIAGGRAAQLGVTEADTVIWHSPAP